MCAFRDKVSALHQRDITSVAKPVDQGSVPWALPHSPISVRHSPTDSGLPTRLQFLLDSPPSFRSDRALIVRLVMQRMDEDILPF